MCAVPTRSVHQSWNGLCRPHVASCNRQGGSATILSVDGIGAFDHVSRAAMLERLENPLVHRPGAPGGMREARNAPSFKVKEGSKATPCHLFSIEVLHPGEQLCAFVDDIHVLCQPDRVKFIHDALRRALLRVAGIHLHQGKTRVWNKGSVQPEQEENLGQDAWQPKGLLCWAIP